MKNKNDRTATNAASRENEALKAEAADLAEILPGINQAQALQHNLKRLQELGGLTGLSKLLHTDPIKGILHVGTIETRRHCLGENALPTAPRKAFLELLLETFDDATLQILMVAAVVSLAIGIYDDPTTGYVEGVAILAAVGIVSLVTAANDYQKESQFRELAAVHDADQDVVVIRAGSHWQIPAREIVVGDVVCCEAGDDIPCDGVLVHADALQVDESALTGEPVEIDKQAAPTDGKTTAAQQQVTDPFVLSGCTVQAGSGRFIAIAVGKDSQWGIIKSHLEKETEETPLQEKLDDMAAMIGYVGMAAAGATFLAMMLIKIFVQPAHLQDISVWSYALEAFIIGVTIVVVAVPEGLPLAVTISLAFSTRKMLADQNLIRHLAACETMGNATNICSDKTGTLTENRMTVVKGIFADTRCDDTIHRVPVLISEAALYHILECIACCSTARIVHQNANQDNAQNTAQSGNTAAGGDKDDTQNNPDFLDLVGVGGGGDETHDTSGGQAAGGAGVAGSGAGGDARPTVIGNKTEAALLLLAQSSWAPNDDTDQRREDAQFGMQGGSRLFPFSSKRKRMTVLVKKDLPSMLSTGQSLGKRSQSLRTTSMLGASSSNLSGPGASGSGSTGKVPRGTAAGASGAQWTMYHKGAAELVLENCTRYLDIDGSEKPMTQEKRAEYEQVIADFASQSLRCVALAHRSNIHTLYKPSSSGASPLDTITEAEVQAKLECDMCLDAICGIVDPLRPDVVDAVATCQRAGIFVRMVTGDNLETAKAIAKQAGILTEGGISMIGEDFRIMTPAQLDEILPRLQVLARSSPEDKHVLVQRLNGVHIPSTEEEWLEAHPGKDFATMKDKLLPGYHDEWAETRGGVGEVVGVTGDGTNDGPALRAADVGLSMGLSGTDVAKKASDIIIMDDRFSSIVKAVLWGRSVFDNIRKFLQFQLTVNVVALTITFLSAVAGYQPPLNAVMMLWVNLIMDTMGALALGTEPPRMELLDRRPYRRDASLISRPMWRNILCQAVYQLMVLLFLLNRGPQIFGCEDGSTHHFSLIFNAFVFCQVFNEFNAREIGDRFDPVRSLGQSQMFLLVILFTVIAQWLIIEYGGDFTQTYPLSWEEWQYTVLLGAGSLPVGGLMRRIPVSEDPESFAGIERKAGRKNSPQRNWLKVLVLVLAPVFAAIVYQLFQEIDELDEAKE